MTMPATTKIRKDVPLDEAYFVWLYSQVASIKNRNRAQTYWSLLRFFYTKEFTWSDIEKDENRAKDGKNLRTEFIRDTGIEVREEGWLELGCSMLELFISLSYRLTFEGDGEPSEWFWGIVENLGLIECTDANPANESILNDILDKVIHRDYASNGAGGLFPLQNSQQDQRNIELWYQAQAYLLERF